MRSILVVNPKGGCGKTTIATNLATYYAVWNTSVALVDLDPQESTLQWLKVRPKGRACDSGLQRSQGYHSARQKARSALFTMRQPVPIMSS